eukprot:TRINITY_DN6084_c0_g1_i1.p1 TRINITY_DN6084_c0_g1~~TRINITY_DN6084_c0_g1_i1.p1  ORF type:complete len:311 (-),score=34.87 TRINITY_DN6084_c0_g1_i1:410-1342(-)
MSAVPPPKPWLQARQTQPLTSSPVPWLASQNLSLQNVGVSLGQAQEQQQQQSSCNRVQYSSQQQWQQQAIPRAPRPWENWGGVSYQFGCNQQVGGGWTQQSSQVIPQFVSNQGGVSYSVGYPGYNSNLGPQPTIGAPVPNSSNTNSNAFSQPYVQYPQGSQGFSPNPSPSPYPNFNQSQYPNQGYTFTQNSNQGGGYYYSNSNGGFRPPTTWESFMQSLNGIVSFFGRISFLVSENVNALNFFITSFIQLLDRVGSLYGELARFVLRILGIKVKKKEGSGTKGDVFNVGVGCVARSQGQGWESLWKLVSQ